MKEIFAEPTRSYNFMKQIIEDFKEDEYHTLSQGWKYNSIFKVIHFSQFSSQMDHRS